MQEVNQQISEEDLSLWREFIKAANAFAKARGDLCRQSSSLVGLVRAGLNEPSERPAALRLVPFLKEEERKELFSDILAIASFVNGMTDYARDLILDFPKDWLMANIEEPAERLLSYGYEEYRGIWEIYIRLDHSLATRLALRAADNPDPDIKEAGDDFLERLARSGQ